MRDGSFAVRDDHVRLTSCLEISEEERGMEEEVSREEGWKRWVTPLEF